MEDLGIITLSFTVRYTVLGCSLLDVFTATIKKRDFQFYCSFALVLSNFKIKIISLCVVVASYLFLESFQFYKALCFVTKNF